MFTLSNTPRPLHIAKVAALLAAAALAPAAAMAGGFASNPNAIGAIGTVAFGVPGIDQFGTPLELSTGFPHGGWPGRQVVGTAVVGGNCSQSNFDAFVGAPVSATADLEHQLPVRHFTPTQRNGTMDYRPERVNFFSDENGIITSYRCG